MEGDETFALELVQDAADVEAAVADLESKLSHEDMEGLGTCRMDAVAGEEADDALTEALRATAPGLVQQLLYLRREQVEQVDTENKELLCQSHNLLTVYA